MKKLSVVIPVYNSAAIVAETLAKVMKVLRNAEVEAEIILVNDGSPDDSWIVIRELALREKSICAIDLLQNYGQHTAVLCGLAHSSGEFIVTMDDDLQNPPSEIIKLLVKIEEGYDLVFARFEQKRHSRFRRAGSRIIGYLNKKIFGKPDDIVLTNFRIFTRETALRVLNYRTNYPYIPGLLLKSAGKIANVTTEHHSRKEGKSNYNILKILQLVGRLLFNYSSFPLRLVSAMGIVVSLLSFIAGLLYAGKSLFLGVAVQGWTTIVVLLSFLLGFVLVILGIMGEYIARILSQLATDQPYQIREIVE